MKLQAWGCALAATLFFGFCTFGSAWSQTSQRCERCDQRLDLSSAEWDCLTGRLPTLDRQRQRSPLVFFTLSEASCRPDTTRARGTSGLIPEATGRRAEGAPRVYRLSSEQIACLVVESPRVQAQGGRVSFDFGQRCTSLPTAP